MAKVYGNRFPETSESKSTIIIKQDGGNPVLSEDITASVSIPGAGISKDDRFIKGTKLEDLWKSLISPNIEPSMESLELLGVLSTYENNTQVEFNSIKINWNNGSDNKSPKRFIFNGVVNNNLEITGDFSGKSYTHTLTNPEIIKISLGNEPVKTSTYSVTGYTDEPLTNIGTVSDIITYKYKLYHFSSMLNTLVGNEQLVLNGNSVFDSTIGGDNTSSVTVLGNGTEQYNWICYPKIWGEAVFYNGTRPLDSMVLEEINVNINGDLVEIYAYRSPWKYTTNTSYNIEKA